MATGVWLVIFFAALGWSAIEPLDRTTWLLEVAPALAALVVLALTRRRFPLTTLSYVLILIHSLILMAGGKYTYAEVPLGDWVSDWFGWGRNNYDKLGHIAQGFIPAVIVREVLVRGKVVSGQAWLAFIVISLCVAFSAVYELLEWMAAEIAGQGAEAFLGTQGYEWDAQSDMLMCFIGASASLLLFSRLHDRQMAKIDQARLARAAATAP